MCSDSYSSSGQLPGPLIRPFPVSSTSATTISRLHDRAPVCNTDNTIRRRQHIVFKPAVRSLANVTSTDDLCSEESRKRVDEVIKHAWADSTAVLYSSAVKQFTNFCELESIPAQFRLPASESLLCAFAASYAGKYAGSSVYSKIAALKAWHNVQGFIWNGGARLRCVLNGVKNLTPSSSLRRPRSPITIAMLINLLERLEPKDGLDSAVACAAVLAFWGQCRLGELLPPSSSSTYTSVTPARSDVTYSRHDKDAISIHLPRTKTHRSGQDIIIVSQLEPLNPISLLRIHLRINGLPKSSPLFSYKSPRGLRVLTKTKFLQRCNNIWSTLGFPRATGHCFRIGGTTQLLLAGVSPEVIKVTGRWSSDSFLRYWRSLDIIAPLHLKNLSSS